MLHSESFSHSLTILSELDCSMVDLYNAGKPIDKTFLEQEQKWQQEKEELRNHNSIHSAYYPKWYTERCHRFPTPMSTLRRKEKNEENFVGQPRQKSKSTASTLRSLRLSFSAVERKLIDHTFGGHRHPVYYESSTESDPESDSGSDLSEEFREKLLDIKETQHQAHAEEATVKQVVRVRYRFLDRLKNVFF